MNRVATSIHGSIEPAEKVTKSAFDYFTASNRNLGLLYFLVDTIATGDEMLKLVRELLAGADMNEEVTPTTDADRANGPRIRMLKKYTKELIEAFYVRLVDNFEVYLSDIVREVLRKKPEILRSRQQTVNMEYVLQFSSIEVLVQDIIEGKVNSLSYLGFAEIEKWYSEKGIPLAVSDEYRARMVEIIATRNIVVHNRSRIDDRYLMAVTNSTYRKGDMKKLDAGALLDAMDMLNAIVARTDVEIAEKFGLAATPFRR